MIGKSIRGILHYNENKVATGEASLIMASGFAGEINDMNFGQKLQRFLHLTMLNPRVKTNALHISLNFDSSEKLDNEKLQRISITYMERIGFGDQPFLAYRHYDAAHQHVHLVTTNVQRDSKRIDLHNIGRDLSEPARKAIEKEFNLVVAENKQFKPLPGIKPADPQKVLYGHLPTKRAISNVVNAVVNQYKFTSLAEFNAVLKLFNVTADRGKEESMMFQKKGLIYSLMDKQGQKIGVPIKSSSFYSKPTLIKLEKYFETNREQRKEYKDNLKSRIDKVLAKYQMITQNTLLETLQKQHITIVFRQNEQKFIYGITFIDHQNKTVFNGSQLGKAYNAKAITELLSAKDFLIISEKQYYLKPQPKSDYLKSESSRSVSLKPTALGSFLEKVLTKQSTDNAPYLQKRKKKKKYNSPQQDQELTL